MVNYESSNQDKFVNANNIPLNNTTIWTSWQSNPVCIRVIACFPDDGCAWSLWPLSPWWRHVTEMSPHWPLEREIHDHCSPHEGPVMSFNVFLAFNQSNCWTKVELLCWWFGTPGRSCHVELITVSGTYFIWDLLLERKLHLTVFYGMFLFIHDLMWMIDPSLNLVLMDK